MDRPSTNPVHDIHLTGPPPTTVDADWVQSPDEQPRNSWTWPWPPGNRPPRRRSEVGIAPTRPTEPDGPEIGIERWSAASSTKNRLLNGIRLKTDDAVSRSILAAIDDHGSVKRTVSLAATGALVVTVVAAAGVGCRRRK